VDSLLDGFAARAFQHEYDHLQGIVNIHRQDAEIKVFETQEALFAFMSQVKKEDSQHYKNPS
jgi:peptide deformylase